MGLTPEAGDRCVLAAAVLVASLCAGCFVNIDFGGTTYQCTDGVCPAGYTCVNEMCVDNPSDGDSGVIIDGAGVDGPVTDGGGQLACGGASALGFSFDGPLHWGKTYAQGGATIEMTGGQMVFTLPANPGQDADGDMWSHMRFDLRNDKVWLQLPQMVNTSTFATVELILTARWDNYVEFLQTNGELRMKSWVNDALDTEVAIPYDPVDHRWWRYREEGGRLYWDTSHDGGVWTERHSIVTPDYVRRSALWFSAYTFPGELDSGEARVDNLNGGGQPLGSWCPMATFTDNFDDNDRGYDWQGWDSACLVRMSSGQVQFIPDANQAADCGYELMTAWDFTDSSAHVEVPSVLDPATDGTTFFVVHDYSDRNASFNIQGGGMGFWLCNPTCNMLGGITYSSTEHRWLRLSESGGEVIWWTSPDGTNWTERHRASHNFRVSQMSVNLGVWLPTGHATPGTTLFDNYNATP